MALDPSTFLSTTPGSATPGQQAQAQQLSDLATPQQIQAMYDYAKALRTSSQDATPIHSWTQGVSNVVKALMGNVETQRAADAERGLLASGQIPGEQTSRPGDLATSSATNSDRPQVSGGTQSGLSTEGYNSDDPAMRQAESGGNDQAKNQMSGAEGPNQFLASTWADLTRRHPDLELTPNGRTDPEQNKRAKAAFDQDNAQVLQTAGYEPNQTNIRLASRFGATGATKVLGSDPNAPMSSIEPQGVMAINPDLKNATAGSTIQRYASLGQPNLPPDAQATVRALNPNSQLAQNGPGLPQGAGAPPDYREEIRQLANRWITNGMMNPQQAMTAATQYVQNQITLGPQYGANPYGQELFTQPNMPAQFTGRQLFPGKEGPAFHGFSTMENIGPDGQLHQQIIVPQAGGASPQAAPGPQGAAQAPQNVGAATPPPGPGAAPQGAAAAAQAPSSVNLAGPAPQGTQVAEPPASANPPAPQDAFSMPPAGAGPGDLLRWSANLDAAQKGAVKQAESMAEAVAKGRVKPIDEAVEEGTKAGPILNDLDTLRDAYANAGDNLNGGPFASSILQAKQAINEFLPGTGLIDQDKTNAAQIVQKVNMGLATKMVKELTSRGTQMEILLAMKNNPGIMMSDKASLYMIDLLKQIQAQKQGLGELATKQGYDNPREWNTMQRSYFETHPLMSPFHPGQPLNAQTANADLASLPSASTPTAQQGAPGFNVPPVDLTGMSPTDARKLQSGTRVKLPDGTLGTVP